MVQPSDVVSTSGGGGEQQQAAATGRKNNFPPLTCIPGFKPCFYQNINEEIILRYRPVVRLAFRVYICLSVYYLFQLAASIACWAANKDLAIGAVMFFFSIGHILVIIPLNYILWFRPIYRAFVQESLTKMNFFCFFAFCLIMVIILAVQAIGIDRYAPGFINGITYALVGDTAHAVAAAFMIVAAIYAVGLIGLNLLLFIKMHQVFKESGANLADHAASATGDAATTVVGTLQEMKV